MSTHYNTDSSERQAKRFLKKSIDTLSTHNHNEHSFIEQGDITMHHLTRVSGNSKTGPIPVSTHTAATCPSGCKLNGNGCYAQSGPLSWHWKRVTSGERGDSWLEFIEAIRQLPKGQLWRYAQAGDLPGDGDSILPAHLRALVRANKNRRGFTYTHKPLTDGNLQAIRHANDNGFTVNVSSDTAEQAVERHKRHNLPAVAVLSLDAPNVQTIDGVKVVACPAEKTDKLNCATCALCADSKRGYVIGFRAHGTSKKKVSLIATKSI